MAFTYDVIVVGGGVVGCAVLHELTLQGYRCLLLEKNENLVSGASGGNSGMFHTGFDASPGTLEHSCIVKGQSKLQSLLKKNSIPYDKSGAIMIVTSSRQVETIRNIHEISQNNKVAGVKLLNAQQVKELEPNLSDVVLGGLLVPGEMVVDSCLVPIAMAHHARRNGAQILYNQKVVGGHFDGSWKVCTESTTFYGNCVINTAGLYGDLLDQILIGKCYFSIKPRKGQFVVFEKAATKLLKKSMILPVPSEKSKGVIIFQSVYGNLVIGPTAEETDEKENPTTTSDVIDDLVAYGYRILPELQKYKIIGRYAGVRPATQFKDYQIIPDTTRKYVTVGGIRSTGVTACLGIASHVLDLLQNKLHIKPSGEMIRNVKSIATHWVTSKPSYVLDGVEYSITHPLMKFGLQPASKL